MKNALIIGLLSLSLFWQACTEEETASNASLLGKWRLTETLMDPGDGSGKWMAAKERSFIEFNKDSSVNTTGDYRFTKFSVIDSTHISFTYANDNKITYRFEVKGNKLFLNPPCIEACGMRYIKVEEAD